MSFAATVDQERQVAPATESLARAALSEAIDRLLEDGAPAVQLISDYPSGDQADAKMATAVHRYVPGVSFLPTVTAEPLNTSQGSFRTLMLALAPEECRAKNVFFYLNVAPIDKQSARNGEHPFCVAVLTNGAVVFSPLAGFSLSAFKPYIQHLIVLKCDQAGKQFRSWQSFPPAIGRVFDRDWTVIDRVVTDMSEVPEFPDSLIADDDPFGNLRTLSVREDVEALGIQWGDECCLLRNGIPVARVLFGDPRNGKKYSNGILSLKPGSNIIEPGGDREKIGFLDLFRVKGRAREDAVLDFEHFRISWFGALSEAAAVASRAARTSGLAAAFRGFFGVLAVRVPEKRKDVGAYERAVPVMTLRKL